MEFVLLPVVDEMLKIYSLPQDFARFQAYLKLLQGNTKDDVALPIGGFNPMAKEQAISRLKELKDLDAEEIIRQTLGELNRANTAIFSDVIIHVALNLSDDVAGGWTNRYSSDYDCKFKISGLLSRHFCTAIFWTSEDYSPELIRNRTLAYCYRTVYWLNHPKPLTLAQHVEQEAFVCEKVTGKRFKMPEESQVYFKKFQHSDAYLTVFNFLYGDAGMEALGNTGAGLQKGLFDFIGALEKNH
jgi:hypothetical protein